MKIDNPAERLINFMNNSFQIHNPQTRNTVSVLREIFQIPSNEGHDVILMRTGELFQLPGKIEAIITEHFEHEDLYSNDWKESILKSFRNMNLSGTFDSLTRTIDQSALREIKLISMMFKTKGTLETIGEEKLDTWKQDLFNLKSEIIENNEYSLDLKKHLVRYINKLILAIESYQINGNEALMDAMEAATGHMLLDPEYREVVMNEQSGPAQQFRDILSSIADATSITTEAIIPLLSAGVHFFLNYSS